MDDLTAYCKQHLPVYGEKQLRTVLVRAGHDPEQVDKALREAAHPAAHLWMYVLVIFFGFAVLGGLYVMVPSPAPVQIPGRAEAPVPADTVPADSVKENVYCDNLACAQEQFLDCDRAEGEYSLFFGTVRVRYEILAREGEWCRVRSWFTQNPEEEFLNKEMVCLWDPTVGIKEAIQDLSRCEGELADAIIQSKWASPP